MVKIHFFALFLAAQYSMLVMSSVVAKETSDIQSGDSSPGAHSVDLFSKNVVKNLAKHDERVQPPVDPSFSAHYQLQHLPSSTVLDQARVLFGPEGMRVDQLVDQSAQVFIANHTEGKFWFVDRRRQLVHAIPVTVSQSETDASGHPHLQSTAGFIQLSPCSGLDGNPGGTGLWRGHTIQRWTCLSRGEVVEEQWFASTPGVVVRSHTSDGYVSELTDLRDRQFNSMTFQPPSHYRQVSIKELMNPAVPIGSYIE